MCETNISLWFVCKLCRGSFGQVDAFIEHKKENHFNEFQNTTSIVFEEMERNLLSSVVTNGNPMLQDKSNEPKIKIEANDEDTITSCSSEIIDELNLDLFEPKSELITYESEVNPENENSFVGLKQPEQNPYVLLKRLTSDEIQEACAPQYHTSFLKCAQKIFASSLENSSDAGSNSYDHHELKSTEFRPTATVVNISTEEDLRFECKLCSKQLQSEAQLKIHVGICALRHKHRNRFCVTCNRKFSNTKSLKNHRLRFHGTEKEKSSLFKFKCHICPKQYRHAIDLRFHLESHEKKKQQVTVKPKKVKILKSNPLNCPHPNCGKYFTYKFNLQRHEITHLDVKPFSCQLCNKQFTQRVHMEKHCVIHTGERPYNCTVDNCNRAFTTSSSRLIHRRTVHPNLLNK